MVSGWEFYAVADGIDKKGALEFEYMSSFRTFAVSNSEFFRNVMNAN